MCFSKLVVSAKYFTMLALTWFLFGVNSLNGKHGKVTIHYFSVLEGWCLVELRQVYRYTGILVSGLNMGRGVTSFDELQGELHP